MNKIYLLLIIYQFSFRSDKMEIIRDTARSVIHLYENVTIEGEQTFITSQQAYFVPSQNIIVVKDSLHIKAREAKIKADSLILDIKNKISHIIGNVEIGIEDGIIYTPQLFILHKKNLAQFPDSSIINIPDKNIKIYGKELNFNIKEKKGMLTKNPILRWEEKDTLTVVCDTLFFEEKTKHLVGFRNVSLKVKETSLYCDSLVYFYEKEMGNAFGTPVFFGENVKIEGDSIAFWIKKDELKRVEVYSNVNAYYITEEKDSVDVQTSRLSVDLKGNEPQLLKFTGTPYGKYFWK